MPWQPLSVRVGKRQPQTPYDGVPPHLVRPLVNWIKEFFVVDRYNSINPTAVRFFGILNEVVVPANADEGQLLNHILSQSAKDQDFCLDMVDSILHFGTVSAVQLQELGGSLSLGGSIWQVAPGGKSLVERLDNTAIQQFTLAVTPDEEASTELAEAWEKAYGRNPNASDAWDHAIKAVETILIPIVCPMKNKPTLADVAGCLKAQPNQWRLRLETNGSHGAVETLEAMLRLMWPNPDRHGGTARRMPSLEEARAVVQLAVTITQWGRTGVLSKV